MKSLKMVMITECIGRKSIFYPYVKRNGFDYEKARKDLKRDYGKEA